MPRGVKRTTQLYPHGTSQRYNHNQCRCTPCTKASTRDRTRHRMIGHPTTVDATGTRRRLQALAYMGWTQAELGERLGWTQQNVSALIHGRSGTGYTPSTRVRLDTAKAVAAIYDDLCMKQGRSNRTRADAVRRGWVSALAWDDIDDVGAKPSPVAVNKARTWRADTDEWLWLVQGGELPERAAERLGVKLDAIENSFRRANRAAEWNRYNQRTT